MILHRSRQGRGTPVSRRALLGIGVLGMLFRLTEQAMSSNSPHQPPARVTAQIILRGEDGRSILDAGGPITAGTVRAFMLPAERIEEAVRRLRELGLDVEPAGGPVLSATAEAPLFERLFHTTLRPAPDGHGLVADPEPRVPDELADIVAAVMVPPPPELFP